MKFLIDMATNPVLVSAAAGWFCAQFLKILGEILKGDFSLKRLKGGGGMPSAHSATVVGLTTGAAITYGGGSFAFAISLFFAIIVMYDAMGVRYETGREARALNLLDRKRRERETTAADREPLLEKPLEEKMGHTLPEIIAGVLVGLIAGIIVCQLLP